MARRRRRRRKKISVTRWSRPEKTVRRWLQQMGLYFKGTKEKVGFLPHGWLPIKGKLSANADFVDYNHRIIIHVDGVHWHGKDGTAHDHAVDAWCIEEGWYFLRLSDLDIRQKPKMCRNMIRRLIRGRIIPVLH